MMDRYIARLMIVPLGATLVLSAMLLVLDKLRRLLDFVANEGGSPSLIWRMLANIIPTYISFGLTIGLLLSVMLTFRRLALSAELDVLRASGVSYRRMLAVPFCYALALAVANVALIGFVQPHARYAYKKIEYSLRSGALGMAVRAGEFSMLGKARMVRIGTVADGELRDVFLSTRERGRNVTASAASARVFAGDDGDSLVFRLTDGVLVDDLPRRATPRVLTFSSHDLRLPLPRLGGAAGRGSDADELTLAELGRAGVGALPHVSPRQAAADLNFRLVEVATLFVLPLLGLALAVPPKRTTSALGVFIAVLLLVLWYKVDQFALARAAAGRADPLFGLWLPFLAFAGLGIWLYHGFAHRIEGRPLESLERGWARMRARVIAPRRDDLGDRYA